MFVLLESLIGRFTDLLRRVAYPPVPSALAGREKLAPHDIWQKFYSDLAIEESDFEKLWREIAAVFYAPPDLLRPSDRFGVELPARVSLAGNDEDVMLGGILARYQKELGVPKAASDPKTVDEVIRQVVPSRTN